MSTRERGYDTSKFDEAWKDFGNIERHTYFNKHDHNRVCDLCFVTLHELDLAAEGQRFYTLGDLKAFAAFLKKWGAVGTSEEPGLNYVAEGALQYQLAEQVARNRKQKGVVHA